MQGTRDKMEVELSSRASKKNQSGTGGRKRPACINAALRLRLQTQHFVKLSGTNFEHLSHRMDQ